MLSLPNVSTASAMGARYGVALLVIGAAIFPCVGRAQDTLAQAAATSVTCKPSFPDSTFVRAPVFVWAWVSDTTQRAMRLQGANLAQVIAEHTAGLLGAPHGTLPPGEPAVNWNELIHSVMVTAHRDGHLTWRSSRDTAGASPRGDAGARLIIRALEAAREAGDAYLIWPAETAGDSLLLQMRLVPTIPYGRDISPSRGDSLEVPIFTVATPREEPVGVVRPPRVRYPQTSLRGKAEAFLVMEFVVDTNGRVDLATLRDIWPLGLARPTGELGDYYRSFLGAVRAALADARYTPARYGGCPRRMTIRQEFGFRLGQ